MTKSEFLKSIERFLEEYRLTPTSFGMNAIKDPNFVFNLRNGRECREETQKKVLEFMENYKADADA